MKYLKRCEKDYTNNIKNIISLINGDMEQDDSAIIYYNIPCDEFGIMYDNLNCLEKEIITIATITITDSISSNAQLINFWIEDFIKNQFKSASYIEQYGELMNAKHNYFSNEFYKSQTRLLDLNDQICTLNKIKKGAVI